MATQISYENDTDLAVPGLFADEGPRRVKSVLLATALAAGLACALGATPVEGEPLPTPDAADVDAFITAGATAATAQNISGGGLDGVVGVGELSPPRNVTFTLSSHADWNLTEIIVTGLDESGRPQQERFVVPDAGNVTLTGVLFFRKVTNVYVAAQGGTGGTFTMGFGSGIGAVDAILHGVTAWHGAREPGEYAAGEMAPVLTRGRVWVYAEAAVDPTKPVYVRLVAGVGETKGRFRGAPDANDCALVRSARWASTTSGEGYAILDLSLP